MDDWINLSLTAVKLTVIIITTSKQIYCSKYLRKSAMTLINA